MTGTNPNPQPSAREENRFVQFLKHLGRLIFNNWGYKLLSLVLAVVLWAGLITQDPSLTREKVMTDGTLTVIGTDTMKRNGFIVTEGLSDLPGIEIRADVPQGQYQAAQTGNYNPRIDLSKVNEAGIQEIRVSTTNSSSYGTVTEVSPETVTLVVEEYITRYRIPVTVETTGSLPEGWYTSAPTLDPPVLAVSGPRSLVMSIVRAEAILDLSTLPAQEGSLSTAVSFRLVDNSGAEIVSDKLEVTSESVLMDSVVLEQSMYPMKTLNLSGLGLVTGTPAEGYEIKSVTITPEIIVAAGPGDVLSELESLYADSTVDVSGLSESVNRQIRVRQPSELVYLSQNSITVAIEIGPIISSRTFHGIRVDTTGLGSGLKVSLGTRTADVDLEGEMLWLVKLRSTDLTLTCDLSGLPEGEYDLPLVCTVSGGEGVIWQATAIPATIHVTLTGK